MTTPRLLIMGPDGCGKDTLARLIRDMTGLRYPEPTSLTWARHVMDWNDGRDIEEWWSKRRDHREEWIDAALRMQYPDPTRLIDIAFQVADIYTGLRNEDELCAALQAYSFRGVLWCWNQALTHTHGMSMSIEVATFLTQVHNVPWFICPPNSTSVRRMCRYLNLPFIRSTL